MENSLTLLGGLVGNIFSCPGSRAPWIFQNPGRPFYRALKSKIGTKYVKLKVKKIYIKKNQKLKNEKLKN